MYEIYTDGACLNNGAPDATGGMGIYSECLEIERSIPWTLDETPTNQRCEMMAVAIALAQVVNVEEKIHIFSDSEYVVRGLNEWLSTWKVNDWKNSKGKPVKNRFLWELLDGLMDNRNVIISHVRAHVGIDGNERADDLANSAAGIV